MTTDGSIDEYNALLNKVKEKKAALDSSAKEYVPKMFHLLTTGKHPMTPSDARGKIQRDCAEIWSQRTILDALPDEAKNPAKQNAGLAGAKKRRMFAAATAAAAQIVVGSQGSRTTEVDHSSLEDPESRIQHRHEPRAEALALNSVKGTDGSSCPSCQILRNEIAELKYALRKQSPFKTAASTGEDIFEIEVPKDNLTRAIAESQNVVYLTINRNGHVVAIDSDKARKHQLDLI